jgi:uroporphyrinogen decarboxylase
MAGGQRRLLLQAFGGEVLPRPPWWLMRQAGRYLPEYRALRTQAASFVEFCLNPVLAAEATLQPVRRFGMDAAIVFADILLVPRALGQRVEFAEDGPHLEALDEAAGVAALRGWEPGQLEPVYETLQRCRAALPAETALIGFAGSPWTVATYMVEGGGSRDFSRVKGWAFHDPEGFAALIEHISEATLSYLVGQVAAGADVVQLFDSWAGVLPEALFDRWVIAPTRQIVAALKQRFPAVPVIGFPRGAGLLYTRYVEGTGIDAIGIDSAVPLGFARDRLQAKVVVQGNLDPVALLVGGMALRREVQRIRAALGGARFVFNLGHGVLPQTPPEHVSALAGLLAEPVAG